MGCCSAPHCQECRIQDAATSQASLPPFRLSPILRAPGPEERHLPIAVVTVNWNGYRDTIECLESLLSADPTPVAVVVVDNASEDGSVEAITQWAGARRIPYQTCDARNSPKLVSQSDNAPMLTILACSSNLGYAGGNNAGLRYLRSCDSIDHFLLLNNDATVAPDFFSRVIGALGTFPDAGILTGTILESAHPNHVWYAGGRFLPWRALVVHLKEVPAALEPIRTEFVSGCAMVISRRALDEIGLLPECYFPLYMEDAEYSYRVLQRGFPVVYVPAAKVYHKVGGTVGHPSRSSWITACQSRHRLFFVRRNLRGWQKVAALMYMLVTKPARALRETAAGRPAIGWATMRGTWQGLVSHAARE